MPAPERLRNRLRALPLVVRAGDEKIRVRSLAAVVRLAHRGISAGPGALFTPEGRSTEKGVERENPLPAGLGDHPARSVRRTGRAS